jgi:hypothetical protein
MSVGIARALDLLSRLVSTSADSRSMAADSVTDWLRSFDIPEAAVISQVLQWLASVETDDAAREAQLHALAELAEHDLVPASVLAEAGKMSRAVLHGSAVEHYDYLRSLSKPDA